MGCFCSFLYRSFHVRNETSLITACSRLCKMLIKAQTGSVILRLVCLSDMTCNYSLIPKHPIVIISVVIWFNYVNARWWRALLTYRHKAQHVLQRNEASVCVCSRQVDICTHSSVVRRFQSEVCVLIKLFHLSGVSDQMPVKRWFMFWSIKQPHDPWIHSVQ